MAKILDKAGVESRYAEEREKRLRSDGVSQFIDLLESEKFKHFTKDPWANEQPSRSVPSLHDGDHHKVIILGTGFAGVLYGIHLINAGFRPEDFIFIDRASGFGGTWYWNRYPGIMCDVESYVYLPLLEKSGYMPKHKYSYGEEIRGYVNRLASKWNFNDRAVFQTEFEAATWNEQTKHWAVQIENRANGKTEKVQISSDFLIVAPGLFTHLKLPKIPGIEDFRGHCFHTSRWDYAYTGGSPSDWTLSNLKGKKVAIVGTGATAIQVVPEVAKWAETLYVVQRTPAAVDIRGQRPTDPEAWKQEISNKPGWQAERIKNFLRCMSDDPEHSDVDLVNDAWSKYRPGAVLTGGPRAKDLTIDSLPAFLDRYRDMDLERQNRVRARVDSTVEDPKTAEKLKAWYSSWCKRPCFHDEYLRVFNRPNVRLLDTQGAGLTKITPVGFHLAGEEIDVDVIIFSTGFEVEGSQSPATQAGVSIVGRNSLTLDEKWERGVATLHGIMTRGFPNLFFPGTSQALVSPNYTVTLSSLAHHAAYVLSTVSKLAEADGASKVILEPTEEAEEEWSAQIVRGALPGAIMAGCTPSYYNREGELERVISAKEQAKMARKAPWAAGPLDFLDVIEAWEKNGTLEGLQVSKF